MSLVAGGCRYVPRALKVRLDPTELKVAPGGTTWIEIKCWLYPQLGTQSSEIAASMRATMPNHFAFMKTPGTGRPSSACSRDWGKFSQWSAKKQYQERGGAVCGR